MAIHENIKGEIKKAMLEKNTVKLGVIRGLVSAFTNEAISLQHQPDSFLSDEEALTVLRRVAKQRKDSIAQFQAAGRQDLVEQETAELAYVETYLPQLMGREEIKKLATAKMAELGVGGGGDAGLPAQAGQPAQAGKLMSALMKDLKGKADGTDVKAVVDELLQ